MITKSLWKLVIEEKNYRITIFGIILTPFIVAYDILLLPLEIICLIGELLERRNK